MGTSTCWMDLGCFSILYIRSYFQSNLYVHPKKCGMWFYVNFCCLHRQNCMTSFQISYSLILSWWWKLKETTTNPPQCVGSWRSFSAAYQKLLYTFVGCWFWTAKYGGQLLLRAPQIVLLLFWGVHHDPPSDGLRLKHEHNTKPMALTGWFCEKKTIMKS